MLCACGCGKRFYPRRSDHRFASNTCKQRFQRAKKKQAEQSAKHALILANLTRSEIEVWSKIASWAKQPFDYLYVIADKSGVDQIKLMIAFMAAAMQNLYGTLQDDKGL